MSELKIISCSSPDKILRINWHILNWCNFKCTYCFAKENLSYDYNDMTQISRNYKVMLSRLKLIKEPFQVCIVGGEPTLHPNIEEILSELNNIDNITKVYFFTNLTRSLDFFKKLGTFEKIIYYASYHPEYHKENFLDKCKELGCEVHISMMSSYKKEILKIIDRCKSEKITHRLNFLVDTPSFTNNLEEDFFEEVNNAEDICEIDVLYNNGIKERTSDLKLLFEGKNYFKGYKCIPESYQIDLDNTVKNVCTNEIMPLSLKNIKKQIICPKNKCEGGLIVYPKELI